MSQPPNEFFAKEAAKRYDERNSGLSRISDCLHFLAGLLLRELPERASVLCVGAGTGAEILSLAKLYPGWSFTALDPSADMLAVCRERLEASGLADRCELVHGYVQNLPEQPRFDAALSFLVGHFVKREERLGFYQGMASRLLPGGHLVNAELSFDLGSAELPLMLKGWEGVQALMGATPESLAALPRLLRDVLTVLPPAEVEGLLQRSGVGLPLRFFQALMICGWYGRKEPGA